MINFKNSYKVANHISRIKRHFNKEQADDILTVLEYVKDLQNEIVKLRAEIRELKPDKFADDGK